jgi:hypothetical protein
MEADIQNEKQKYLYSGVKIRNDGLCFIEIPKSLIIEISNKELNKIVKLFSSHFYGSYDDENYNEQKLKEKYMNMGVKINEKRILQVPKSKEILAENHNSLYLIKDPFGAKSYTHDIYDDN